METFIIIVLIVIAALLLAVVMVTLIIGMNLANILIDITNRLENIISILKKISGEE